ncbi:MAG: hypothetical protein A2X94_08405 [Bdellovibrionales bacterium GWB1_55_8]|nr:MAG: hypothetical protein A2X94_08405 [Bdellovibrionales bacterium GWB1_55_8]
MKIFLESNGCLSRSLDLKRIKDYFIANGCEIVSRAEDADEIVFLGCAAVKKEEDWSFEVISKLKQGRANLIVGGCVKDISEKRRPEIKDYRTFSTKELGAIERFFPDFKTRLDQVPDANEGLPRNLRHYITEDLLSFSGFHLCYLRKFVQHYRTRLKKKFVIRISGGCEPEHCSFCAIWKAIGPYRSKSIEACLLELDKAKALGIRRINIVADNIGAYGIDTGQTLPSLLSAMVAHYPEVSFQIEELSPKWFITYKDYFYELARDGKIATMHTPLQSGSDRILKAMNRRYTATETIEALAPLKKISPQLGFYTDLIVGFPSETDDDFKETLRVVKAIGFDSLSYYEYDSKNNFPSLQEVSKDKVKSRLNELTDFLWANGIGGGPF